MIRIGGIKMCKKACKSQNDFNKAYYNRQCLFM